MHMQGLKMDYQKGKLIFPKQIINEQQLDFIPNRREERDFFFDLFKYEMLEQNRLLMRDYFNINTTAKNGHPSNKIAKLDNNQLKSRNYPKSNYKNTNLYMRIQINGRQLFALIDTGADTSKISDSLALQCGILQFIDYDKSKISHGLGSMLICGQISPIPVQIESLIENNSKLSTTLFVPFEVIKENQVHVLLGSDFFSNYSVFIDFTTKSIDIPLNPPCKCRLEEQEPRNINLINNDDKKNSIQLDCNYNFESNDNELMNAYQLVPELDELQIKIRKKEHEYQIRRKLKKYKIRLNKQKELDFLRRATANDQHLFSTALLSNDLINLSELDELSEQASKFLQNEINLINNIQEFKNQKQSPSQIYCNGFLSEHEIQDSIVKINFVCKSF